MERWLVFCCLVVCSLAAPGPAKQHHVTSHNRHNAPARSNYKYLPTLEDADEPRGRQEKVGQQESVVAAPIVEPAPKETQPSNGPVPQSRPVGPPDSAGKPVERPPFRPGPPPKAQKQKEEEEEEDDESDEDVDDESEEGDDEEDDDGEEEEEDRKRQENVAQKNEKEAPAQPVVKSQPAQSSVSVESSVEDVRPVVTVDSNEVVAPSGGLELDDGMEALVPGYVTDQGEVLVPVDTVSGDQHISIVPDPYTRESHGVHSHHSRYRSHPVFYESEHEGYFDY